MAGSQPTLKNEIVRKYVSKFPNTSNYVLAKKILKENPLEFDNVENIRTMIRYVTGNCGRKDNKKLKDIKFYFKRLLEEDFPTTRVKFLEKSDDMVKFLIDLININFSEFEWRNSRGYFLVDKIESCSMNKKVYLFKT